MQWTFWRRTGFLWDAKGIRQMFWLLQTQTTLLREKREPVRPLASKDAAATELMPSMAAQPCNPSSQELSTLETDNLRPPWAIWDCVSENKTNPNPPNQTKTGLLWVYRLAGYIHSRNNHLALIYFFVCLFIYIYKCLCVCTPNTPVSNSQVLELQMCAAVLFMWCC